MTPLDPQLAAILPPAHDDAPSLFELDPIVARGIFDEIVAGKTKGPDYGITSEDDDAASSVAAPLPVRIYRPADVRTDATLVFLHGGGYMLGGLNQMDGEARLLCHLTGAVVVAVDYRLAPEHPLPAAHDDAVAAVRWTASQVIRWDGAADRLCLAGESAGANLAASAAIELHHSGFRLVGQLLIVPAPDAAAWRTAPDAIPAPPLLTARDLRAIAQRCLPDAGAADQFPFSAAQAEDLTGLPPTVIGVAGHCPTRDIGLAFADRLRSEGNVVHVHDFADLFHPFFAFTDASASARRAAETLCTDFMGLIGSTASE